MDNILGGARDIPYDEKHKGISRKRVGDKFVYFYVESNKRVNNKDQARINKLGIPPAWDNIWVSCNPNSAIQATGIDSKGRKQYRYHQQHIKKAEENKFLRMYDFVKATPKLDRIIKKHEKLPPYSLKRVIASMLTIVKELHMRVGKEVYARKNKSYGVSSLRKIHMQIEDDVIRFRFKGKSKKRVSYTLKHPVLAKHLNMLLKLEGPRLFQFVDETTNTVKNVTDRDLNRYIQKYVGKQFTVKDFRSAASNHYFIKALLKETQKRSPKNDRSIKKNILNALKSTSHYLRHTKAISKKSYVLNLAIDMYRDDPKYFVKRKNEDPDEVLLDILKIYRQKVLKI